MQGAKEGSDISRGTIRRRLGCTAVAFNEKSLRRQGASSLIGVVVEGSAWADALVAVSDNSRLAASSSNWQIFIGLRLLWTIETAAIVYIFRSDRGSFSMSEVFIPNDRYMTADNGAMESVTPMSYHFFPEKLW